MYILFLEVLSSLYLGSPSHANKSDISKHLLKKAGWFFKVSLLGVVVKKILLACAENWNQIYESLSSGHIFNLEEFSFCSWITHRSMFHRSGPTNLLIINVFASCIFWIKAWRKKSIVEQIQRNQSQDTTSFLQIILLARIKLRWLIIQYP